MAAAVDLLAALGLVVGLCLVVVGLAIGYHWARSAFSVALLFRGQTVVACPHTRTPAVVVVDVVRAALTAYRRRPDLRLAACSRWPEKSGCAQDCLCQIQAGRERRLAWTLRMGL